MLITTVEYLDFLDSDANTARLCIILQDLARLNPYYKNREHLASKMVYKPRLSIQFFLYTKAFFTWPMSERSPKDWIGSFQQLPPPLVPSRESPPLLCYTLPQY